jgi:hypothetical protein
VSVVAYGNKKTKHIVVADKVAGGLFTLICFRFLQVSTLQNAIWPSFEWCVDKVRSNFRYLVGTFVLEGWPT